jgi:hypothetical protein
LATASRNDPDPESLQFVTVLVTIRGAGDIPRCVADLIALLVGPATALAASSAATHAGNNFL